MLHLQADKKGLRLLNLPVGLVSVDVLFDGHRVWSIDLRGRSSKGNAYVSAWPSVLVPYLTGETLLSITDSGSGEKIDEAEIKFDETPTRVQIVGSDGAWLSVNKWGRLAAALEARSARFQEHIIERTTEIIAVLQSLGLQPFLVGGTLLGAVRSEALLSHDDDADVAYLSEFENPVDVAVQGYRVGRKLQELGFKLVRHSATHMQLHFETPSGEPYYIDVFAAFFTSDGHINQPFHVRGPARKDQLLPFSEVTINGQAFPAPRDTDHWLTINYDAQWRTPVPGFKIVTPEATSRRFLKWFGSFRFQGDFWDDFYASPVSNQELEWVSGAEWVASQQLNAPQFLELGCGSAALSAQLASPARAAIATDFSAAALKTARARIISAEASSPLNMRVAQLNLYRLNALAAADALELHGVFDAAANHVLEQVGHAARPAVYRLFRQALLRGGSAYAVVFGRPAVRFSAGDPTTWHLDRKAVLAEVRSFGLQVSFTEIDNIDGRDRYGITFALANSNSSNAQNFGSLTMKQRLKNFLQSFAPGFKKTELERLRQEVVQLRAELDEYRELSSRIAQLTDLAEEKLSSL